MDAHHRCERRGNHHLQWQWQPTHKKANCDAAGDRSSIQMPDHRLRERIFEPDFYPRIRPRRIVMQTKAVSYSPLHIVGSWQSVFQPFLAHAAEEYSLDRVSTFNVGLPKIFNAGAEFRELAEAVQSGDSAWDTA